MASTLPPVKGAAFTFDISLVSVAAPDTFQTSITLAAGDVIVYQNGVLDGNIDALPTEIGTSGVLVVALSAAEMTADRVTVRFHDAAGDEWQDALVTIYTCAQTLDTIDANVDSVLTDTAEIGAAGAGLTALGDTRLDNLDAAVSTRSTLDAAGVRSAVGMSAANLDTQLSTIQSDLDSPNQYKADVSGLSTLDATGVRAAIGMALANLDDQLAAIGADAGEDVWLTILSGYAEGTAGRILYDAYRCACSGFGHALPNIPGLPACEIAYTPIEKAGADMGIPAAIEEAGTSMGIRAAKATRTRRK